MSPLTGKNVLIVSDNESVHESLTRLLKIEGATVLFSSCSEAIVSILSRNNISVALLCHTHGGAVCGNFFAELKNTRFLKEISIFTEVANDQQKINEALMLGAADYFTTDESTISIIKKIKIVLGEPERLSSSSLFEVPNDAALISTTNKKVLVVEDDTLLRNLLDAKLTLSGLPHEFSETGDVAYEKVRAYKPNVIILDLMLPKMDGFEILEALKADSNTTHIPVIVFSNRDSEEDKKRAFSLGADRYYVKAMTDLSVLIEAVDELV